MSKNIHKLLPPYQIGIPLTGLVLILGVVVANQAKPVLSNQTDFLSASTGQIADSKVKTYTWLQRSAQEQKEVRLRSALNSEFRQNSLKEARLRKAIARNPTNAPSQVADNHELTYTWLQRHPSADRTKQEVTPSLESPTTPIVAQTEAPETKAIAARSNFPKLDGVYLYGESAKPGQSGQGYIIFEKQQGNVVGALYQPNSEYSCFNGTLQSTGQLAMNVNGYPGEVGPIRVATKNPLQRVNNLEPVTYSHSEALQDYYQLNSVSANDLKILQQCKALNS